LLGSPSGHDRGSERDEGKAAAEAPITAEQDFAKVDFHSRRL
jgi:hypothetical protein